MALTRTAYAAANTADFAAALKTALEATSLFDSVTRSETTVTCTKDSQDILTIALGADGLTTFITINDSTGSELYSTPITTGAMNAPASISTDGNFVFIVMTNGTTQEGSGKNGIRSAFLYVGKTKTGKVGIAFSYRFGNTIEFYPQTNAAICSEESFAADNGTAFAPARSTNYAYFVTYPLSVQKADGSVNTFDGALGVLAAPSVFQCSKSLMGVLPTKTTIDGKDYITDGCILIEVSK